MEELHQARYGQRVHSSQTLCECAAFLYLPVFTSLDVLWTLFGLLWKLSCITWLIKALARGDWLKHQPLSPPAEVSVGEGLGEPGGDRKFQLSNHRVGSPGYQHTSLNAIQKSPHLHKKDHQLFYHVGFGWELYARNREEDQIYIIIIITVSQEDWRHKAWKGVEILSLSHQGKFRRGRSVCSTALLRCRGGGRWLGISRCHFVWSGLRLAQWGVHDFNEVIFTIGDANNMRWNFLSDVIPPLEIVTHLQFRVSHVTASWSRSCYQFGFIVFYLQTSHRQVKYTKIMKTVVPAFLPSKQDIKMQALTSKPRLHWECWWDDSVCSSSATYRW